MRESLARSKWKSSHTTNMARIMVSKQYVGSSQRCMEQPIEVLFFVHDVQFAIKIRLCGDVVDGAAVLSHEANGGSG